MDKSSNCLAKNKKKHSYDHKNTSEHTHLHPPTFRQEKAHLATKYHTFSTQEEYVSGTDCKKVNTLFKTVSAKNKRKGDKHSSRRVNLHKTDRKSPTLMHRKDGSPQVKAIKTKRNIKKGGDRSSSQKQEICTERRECPKRQARSNSYDKKQYQNFLIQQTSQRPITEISQSLQMSPLRQRPLNIQKIKEIIAQTNNTTRIEQRGRNKRKGNSIRQLKQNIFRKYSQQFSFMNEKEVRFFCSIVLVQRLWKQKRAKKIIQSFIMPLGAGGEDSGRKVVTEQSQQSLSENTSELIEKHKNAENFDRLNQKVSKQNKIVQNQQGQEDGDRGLSESSLNKSQKQMMMKLVECMKGMMSKSDSQKWISRKIGLTSSYSQKCFIHKLYRKACANREEGEDFNLLPIESPCKTESINENSHLREEKEEEKTERKMTQMYQEVFCRELVVKVPQDQLDQPKVKQFMVQTEEEDDPKNTLKDIKTVAQSIVDSLLFQFSKQYKPLVARSIKLKKRSHKIPGLVLTEQYIRNYLEGFIQYALDHYQEDILRRYNSKNPLCYLKLHYEYEDEEEEDLEDLQSEFNQSIIPNQIFYYYQLESDQVNLTQQQAKPQEKCVNLLSTLTKICNLLLANTLSQQLQRYKIQHLRLPWQPLDARNIAPHTVSEEGLARLMNGLIEAVLCLSNLNLGMLGSSPEDGIEKEKINDDVREEYEWEWNCRDEAFQFLEYRMGIAQDIQDILFEEVISDFIFF